MYKFTIAIPTLQSRLDRLGTCLTAIHKQIAENDAGELVEVLTFIDDRTRSIGYKRNWLLQRARGEFTAFVDDDDRLAPTYMSRILTALQKHPDVDVLGMTGTFFNVSKGRRRRFIHSLRYTEYFEKGNVLYRCPNHLNPMRTEIARRFQFPDKSFGEDTDWALNICRAGALKTEHFLGPHPLYLYDFVQHKRY